MEKKLKEIIDCFDALTEMRDHISIEMNKIYN